MHCLTALGHDDLFVFEVEQHFVVPYVAAASFLFGPLLQVNYFVIQAYTYHGGVAVVSAAGGAFVVHSGEAFADVDAVVVVVACCAVDLGAAATCGHHQDVHYEAYCLYQVVDE